MNSANKEQSEKTSRLEFDRVDVLARLWSHSTWLNERIEKTQLKVTTAQRQRVYMIQTDCAVCKTILYGLKDETIELRLAELEKKLENGVIIPRG